MTFEVELKFPLAEDSRNEFVKQIEHLGAKRGPTLQQLDVYYAHPSRDFGQTNEAFRIRSVDEENYVTYKGPLIDQHTKTRHEIEVPVASGAEQRRKLAELLEHLGFSEFGSVRKVRQTWHLKWQERELEIVIDDVADLGLYVELECLAAESCRDEVRDSLLQLAADLGLSGSERRSYLQLLRERQNPSAGG